MTSVVVRKKDRQTVKSRETRFGEISPLQDNVKNFGHFEWAYLVFVKILSLLWQILNSIEQIIIVENGKILNKHSNHLVTLVKCDYTYFSAQKGRKIKRTETQVHNRHRSNDAAE